MNHSPINLSFLSLQRIIPHLITSARALLSWPMILALKEKNFWQFFLWLLFFLVLDKLDGILARQLNSESEAGRIFDSFVDKVVFLILLVASGLLGLLPFFLVSIILGINFIQLLLTWGAILRKKRELPKTYLSFFSAVVLLFSLFSKEPFSYLAYLLAIALSLNHLYYYGKKLYFKEFESLRLPLIRQAQKIRAGFPFLERIFSYYSEKIKKRKESFSAFGGDTGIYTWANLLTVGRIILIPLIIYYYFMDKIFLWIILLVIFVGGDFLDGAIARSFNQVSYLGKILDAAADKIIFFAFLVVWLFEGLLPTWLFWFLIARIVIVALMAGLILFFTKKKTLPIAFYSFISVISLLGFLYWQNGFLLGLTVLFTWQLIVNYWYQGIPILLTKRRSFLTANSQNHLLNRNRS